MRTGLFGDSFYPAAFPGKQGRNHFRGGKSRALHNASLYAGPHVDLIKCYFNISYCCKPFIFVGHKVYFRLNY